MKEVGEVPECIEQLERRKTRKKKQGCSVTGYRTCNFNTKT